MRRALLILATAVSLVPVWSFRHLPTQDGASHVWNAQVFRDCVREERPEHEFYARRLNPVPNWTAPALLLGLTAFATPDTSEKLLASLYVVGLPLALWFFLGSLGLRGEAALFGLLLVFNRCFFLGFSNYLLSLVLYFVVLGVFLRWPQAPSPRDMAGLAVLLLLTWFTHLFGFLLATVSLVWLAASGPGPKMPRLPKVALALVPGLVLTGVYLVTSGFFDPAVARRAARGVSALATDAPAALHLELFAIHAGAWPLGLAGLGVAILWVVLTVLRGRDPGAWPDLRSWKRSLAVLAVSMLVAFAVVPDHLGAQGGFLKARLAPLPFLLGASLLPEASRRGARALGALCLLVLLGLNLHLVRSYLASASRDLEEFEAATPLVKAGETLLALKPRPDDSRLVDIRAAEHYCLATGAVCLGNYEAATRHFPVQLRPGVKERLKQNRPGTFWADVLLAWEATEDQLPLPEEPYREVYRKGSLRLYRRGSTGAPR